MNDIVEPVEQPKPKKPENPLLSRRMVNAYARTLGCTEYSPEEACDHRILAKRALTELVVFYGLEKDA